MMLIARCSTAGIVPPAIIQTDIRDRRQEKRQKVSVAWRYNKGVYTRSLFPCQRTVERGVLSEVSQSSRGCGLSRACSQSLEQWQDQLRSGDRQVGQASSLGRGCGKSERPRRGRKRHEIDMAVSAGARRLARLAH